MKAYWIAHVTVKDPDRYQHYAEAAPEAFRKYRARFLARGGRSEQLELDVARADDVPLIEIAVLGADGSLAVGWAEGTLDVRRERWRARLDAPATAGDYRLVARLVLDGREIHRSSPVPLTVT